MLDTAPRPCPCCESTHATDWPEYSPENWELVNCAESLSRWDDLTAFVALPQEEGGSFVGGDRGAVGPESAGEADGMWELLESGTTAAVRIAELSTTFFVEAEALQCLKTFALDNVRRRRTPRSVVELGSAAPPPMRLD